MAIEHFTVKVGRREHSSAARHAVYICREGEYASRLLTGKEILAATKSGNMPSWAVANPSLFWCASDTHERENGSVYREIEAALPRELTPDNRQKLIDTFIDEELGVRHAYQYAIHVSTAADGGENPHVHLMFSERRNDGVERGPELYFRRANKKDPTKGGALKGFGARAGMTLSAEQRAFDLLELRLRWVRATNSALIQQLGIKRAKPILLTLQKRDDGVTEPKLGPRPSAVQRDKVALIRLIRRERAALEAMSALEREQDNMREHLEPPLASSLRGSHDAVRLPRIPDNRSQPPPAPAVQPLQPAAPSALPRRHREDGSRHGPLDRSPSPSMVQAPKLGPPTASSVSRALAQQQRQHLTKSSGGLARQNVPRAHQEQPQARQRPPDAVSLQPYTLAQLRIDYRLRPEDMEFGFFRSFPGGARPVGDALKQRLDAEKIEHRVEGDLIWIALAALVRRGMEVAKAIMDQVMQARRDHDLRRQKARKRGFDMD